jgi:hypothetical protein
LVESQVSPVGQPPQVSVPPQLSLMVPHVPAGHWVKHAGFGMQ